MEHGKLRPTEDEIGEFMLSMLQHSCHVEYFLREFGLKTDDPERPHDLAGAGNKFEWDVMRGLALQYRKPEVDFGQHILPSLNIHRGQYHHRKWNGAGTSGKLSFGPGATLDDMWVGAIDAVCSHREDRKYQGGALSYDDIYELAEKERNAWMLTAIPEMRQVRQPNLGLIGSLGSFPNIGLDEDMHGRIVRRVNEAVLEVKGRGY